MPLLTDGQTWDAVDSDIAGRVLGSDEALDATSAASGAANLPAIAVSPLRLEATAIQTIGSKGYDGFVYALVG